MWKAKRAPALLKIKEGVRRYTTEIIPDNFTLLGRKNDFETDKLSPSPAESSEH
jgi:single-strand DNA-binding protein